MRSLSQEGREQVKHTDDESKKNYENQRLSHAASRPVWCTATRERQPSRQSVKCWTHENLASPTPSSRRLGNCEHITHLASDALDLVPACGGSRTAEARLWCSFNRTRGGAC